MKILIRKAVVEDAKTIFDILNPYTREGIILKLTINEIIDRINNFFVAVDNNETFGVVSFYDYGKELKEIRSLAVKKRSYKKGVGRSLVQTLVNELNKEFPEAKIFVLSYTPEFFKKLNFLEIHKDSLPEKIWKDCRNCKNRDNCGETALLLKSD